MKGYPIVYCEECEVPLVDADINEGGDTIAFMYRTTATDEERSNGPEHVTKVTCWECAWKLFETGEWESGDPRDFSTEASETPDGIRYHMAPPNTACSGWVYRLCVKIVIRVLMLAVNTPTANASR